MNDWSEVWTIEVETSKGWQIVWHAPDIEGSSLMDACERFQRLVSEGEQVRLTSPAVKGGAQS